MTQHLMGGADLPQEEPGDCTNLGETRRRRWSANRDGRCHGCKSWQPVKMTLAGWRLCRHTPAPPRFHDCGNPNHDPYPYPSYTQPPCDDCAAQTDADSYAEGRSINGHVQGRE